MLNILNPMILLSWSQYSTACCGDEAHKPCFLSCEKTPIKLLGVILFMCMFFSLATYIEAATPEPTATPGPPTATPEPTATSGPGTAIPSETMTFTPTVTVTAESHTITMTITVTNTPIIAERVRLNRNSINPEKGENLSILGLSPEHELVTIKIYTQEGRLIKTLWNDRQPGLLEIPRWDGRKHDNQIVASGVYMVIINGKKLKKRLRIAVIK